jgi:hypothetical protein
MKNIFYILLLLPTIIFAQYPSNSGHKITLGEQTTADGLIWRGVAADTTLTVKSDTAAYFVLDTVNINLYTYKVSASGKKWIQLGSDTTSLNLVSRFATKLNISDTASMLTPYLRKLDTTNIKYVNTYGTQTVNGAKTFSSTVTGARFDPTSSSASGNGMFLPTTNTLGLSTAGLERMRVTSGFVEVRSGAEIRYMNDANNDWGLIKFAIGGLNLGGINIQNSGGINSMYPITDNVTDLGTSSRFYKNGFINNLSIGISSTARLHIASGTATANTAPLKFTSGTNLTTAEAGAMEFSLFNGANRLFITPESGVRKEIGYADLSNVSGTLPVANGGTGSATQNFVDLTTTQSIIGGAKTFTDTMRIEDAIKVGANNAYVYSAGTGNYYFTKDYKNQSGNHFIIIGDGSMSNATTVSNPTSSRVGGVAIGYNVMKNLSQSASTNNGVYNSGVGYGALESVTTGNFNTAFGLLALNKLTTGGSNAALGTSTLENATTTSSTLGIGDGALRFLTSGSDNVAIGSNAGTFDKNDNQLNEINQSVLIGRLIKPTATSTNEIILGYAAVGQGSNSVMLGNSSITKTILNGNVGIGTTSPTDGQLHISGNSDSGPSPNRPRIALTNNAGTAVTWTIQPWSTSGDANLSIYRSGSTGNILLAATGGNVGIGTTNPITIFDVRSTIPNILISGLNNADPAIYFVRYQYDNVNKSGAAIKYIYGSASANQEQGSLGFYTAPSDFGSQPAERVRITNNGNVGIGTASPTNGKLVVKSGESNSTGIVLERGSNTDKLVNIFSETADGKIAIASGANTKIFLNSVGNSYFTGGNVGIGTATPQVTLEVFNSVNVPQFTVYNGTNWIILRGDAPLIGRTSGKDLLFLTYDTYPTTGAVTQMTLQSNGKLKIVDLAGIGDIGADANGVLQAATSDMNLKNTIENSPFGLNEILLLNPVTFLYNDINRKLDSNIKEVGFIAQDVFDIIPNAVSSTGTGDLQLDYRAITATLTKAIQEQQAIIKALEQRIINLENK